MTCERISQQLEDLLDGELGAAEQIAVEQHLETCAGCSSHYEALVREQQLYAAYDRDLATGDAMWQGVLARIEPETPRPNRPTAMSRVADWFAGLVEMPRFAPVAITAAALVVTGIVTLVALRGSDKPPVESTSGGQYTEGPYTPPGPGSSTTTPAPPPTTEQPKTAPAPKNEPRTQPRVPHAAPPKTSVSALPATVVDAERDYLKAIAALSKDVERGRGDLDPVLRNKLERPLTSIDQNIVAAREAVRKNPNDTTAVLNMFAAYDNKVDVLQQLARYQVAQNR